MRGTALRREAFRNLVSGTTRAGVFALALTVTSAGLALADLSVVRALETQAQAFQASGASVMTIVAVGRVDGRVCESLRSLPGVRAAGALRESSQTVRALALPGAPLQTKDVTVGFLDVLAPEHVPTRGIALVRVAAEQLGLRAGDLLRTDQGQALVATVFDYPDDGRRAGLGYAALLPTIDTGAFDECWVDAWPMIPALSAILLTTVMPSTGARDEELPAVGQLNTRLGAAFAGPALFDSRITAAAPLVAVALGIVLGALSVRVRRMQLASALHSRVRRRDLQSQILIETAAWSAPTLVVGIAICGFAAALSDHADQLAMTALVLRAPTVAAVGALLGATLALGATRERHLFRYFKDR